MIARPLERLFSFGLRTLPEVVLTWLGGSAPLVKGESLDPLANLLVRFSQHVMPLEQLSIHRAREVFAQRTLMLDRTITAGVEHKVIFVPRLKHFESMRVDVYKPQQMPKKPALILFLHGGGWCMGDSELSTPFCSLLSAVCNAVVFSPSYLLAPEYPFPAGLNDCRFAYDWMITTGARLMKIKSSKIVIGGNSAGATLAAVLCQQLRDQHAKQPHGQLLIDPYLDLSDEVSLLKNEAAGYFLNPRLIQWFKKHYLPPNVRDDDPAVSPLLAESVQGLPPAVICLPGFSPLSDKGREYAKRLEAAGIPVKVIDHPNQAHAYISYADFVPNAKLAALVDACAVRDMLIATPKNRF